MSGTPPVRCLTSWAIRSAFALFARLIDMTRVRQGGCARLGWVRESGERHHHQQQPSADEGRRP